jgi:photosystem II stability/assembly factor-like uncharacterized protein
MSKTFVVLTLALALLQRSIVNAQWVQTSVLNHGDVPSIAVNGSSVFAAGSGLYRSTDNGTHWQEADSGLINNLGFYPGVRTFAFSDTDIFAGTGDGVFRSTNNGANWTAVNTSIEDLSLAVIGSDLIAGTPYGWIYLSTNNGTTWNSIRPDSLYSDVTSFAVIGSDLIAGTDGDEIYCSSNDGTNWLHTYDQHFESHVLALAVMPNGIQSPHLFMATRFGFFYSSTDTGNTWTTLQTSQHYEIYSLIVYGTNLLAGTNGAGVLLSTDKGITWTEINTGLPSGIVWSLAICGSTLYAGTDTSGLWQRPLGEIITEVEKQTGRIPSRFIMNDNYPNPCNPSTTISFTLPSRSFVTLKIFDVLGTEVATIVSEEMMPGNYSKQWNAGNIASGVYFYRLQAGTYSETKKLLLLK